VLVGVNVVEITPVESLYAIGEVADILARVNEVPIAPVVELYVIGEVPLKKFVFANVPPVAKNYILLLN